MKSNNFFFKNISIFFLIFYFFIGLFLVDDYGISVDEEFQRFSGFYWLNFILELTSFENFKIYVENKFEEINGLSLPNPKNYKFYGVIYDLPLAFIEAILKIEEPKEYFLLRHYANFTIFFISSVFFYLILKNRFKNDIIIFLGLLLYVSSPRIFGHSFYNNKDIVFLSLVTVTFFFIFKFIEHKNLKNIIIAGLFSSITCASRIVGIFIPLFFIFYLIILKENEKFNIKKKIKIISLYLLTFFLFLIIFWPYLWASPFNNFVYSLKIFSKYPEEFQMLFNGRYVNSNYLPLSYLPTWITITMPLLSLFLFLNGFINFSKRFFLRLVNIKENFLPNDFWRSINESKDFIIFTCFLLIFFYIILSNTDIYNGWRHLYFLHFFITYIAIFGLHILNIKFKKIKHFLLIPFLFIMLNFYDLIKFHPYQGSYFNQLILKSKKNSFEVDYWGTAGVRFLKEILSYEKNSDKINIAVASFLPLERSVKLLDYNEAKKIRIVGQDYSKAEYIFNNNISEVNKFKNKKYEIPNNFKKISEFYIKDFMMYEIYKKN